MPLSHIQKDVLQLLATHRRDGSHLAGGAAINRADDSVRFSADLDLFHDHPEELATYAQRDVALLLEKGFAVEWLERRTNIVRANVNRGDETLKVEWCHDSAFRFFPIQNEPNLGFCLHPADLATNKALALGGRAEIRDFIDIVFLHQTFLSLGAICWAACGKDPGFTPWSLLEFARRHMKFREEQLVKEKLARPITLQELKTTWLSAVEQAENLFARLPLKEVGCLFIAPPSTPVTPDPAAPNFPSLIRHYGSIRGAWPKIV